MGDGDIAVGLVGAGRIARLIHLPVLTGLAGVRVVAVAEPSGDARTAAGALVPGARLYASLEEMLSGPTSVDAVVVCAPTGLHAEIASTALAAGRSVYLEKPIATTLADGRALIAMQRAVGAVCMTGFVFRFSQVFAEARMRIAAGAIGEIIGGQSVFTSPAADGQKWKHHRASGGGALLDLLPHHADIVRWLLGEEVASVAARVRSLQTEADTAAVAMSTTSGITVQTFVSTSAAEEHRFEIVGTTGRLALDPWRMASPEHFAHSGTSGRGERLRQLSPRRLLHRPDYHAPFRGVLQAFATAVGAGESSEPDFADGLASLAVIDAAERAAVSGAEELVEATAMGPRDGAIARPSLAQ